MTAYVIAQIDLHDEETYAKYTAQTPGTVADHGGRFIVRGGRWESLEGSEPGPRVVVIEFPAHSEAWRPPIPIYRGHRFRFIAATDSDASRPVF